MRRSSRLSGASVDSNDSSDFLTASRPTRKSTAASTRSSGASSAVIPTVAARASRKAAASGTERRLEDLLDEPGNETRPMDVSLGPFVPVGKTTSGGRKAATTTVTASSSSSANPSSDPFELGHSEPSSRSARGRKAADAADAKTKASRKPRSTLGEEAEDDFIFKRATTSTNGHAPSSSSSSMGPPAAGKVASRKRRAVSPGSGFEPASSGSSAPRRTYEPLPDAELGETPIIRRNKNFRAGLDLHPSAIPRMPSSAGRQSSRSRRSSLGLKGSKRVSSLRDGTAAYPHDDVPDRELYRHCSSDLPPVVRMRHLIGWVLKRSIDAALGKVDLAAASSSSDAKGKKKKLDSGEALPVLTDQDKRELKLREAAVKRVLEQVLTDLSSGAFSISWMGEVQQTSKSKLQPHPRNVSNREAEAKLGAIVDKMTQESKAWAKEQLRIEDYEAETSRLEELLAAEEADADDTVASQVDDVLEWTPEDLDEATARQLKDAEAALTWIDRLVSGQAASTTKGKARRQSTKSDENATAQGTELDPRWKDVEYNVDLLRSRSHQFAQLESLAARYVRTVSAQAAQALRDRTSSGDRAGGSKGRLDRLLSGVRESRSDAGLAAGEKREDEAEQAFEPDESDAMDLLRALAKT